jgi:hypothetical protein
MKINNIIDLINGNREFRILTYKLNGVYFLDVEQYNGIFGKWIFVNSKHYNNKHDLFKNIEKASHYLKTSGVW